MFTYAIISDTLGLTIEVTSATPQKKITSVHALKLLSTNIEGADALQLLNLRSVRQVVEANLVICVIAA